MADAGSHAKRPDNSFTLTEEGMRQTQELLFFAYRDFTGEADALLADFGFGRAHHRVIYFVGRHPGMAVSELLGILKITKQSLSRVLSQLINDGFILQRSDAADRRRRHLYLTAKGVDLERRLTERQSQLIAGAYQDAGAEAAQGFRAVLRAIINEQDRARVAPREAVE
ncbi:MAG: MarR family winged helix-turn-helix transcriptional regulator [Proteobacteria bacterium]|nr:MarR family winged helix-turn-helix transcriptional regulator [Pseudomonadota bacterium]